MAGPGLAGRRSLPPRTEVFHVEPRVLIDNNASRTHTVIEVNGRDRPGLLYDVAKTLKDLGMVIFSAHISTYGERVVDVFYVKDVFGLKVTQPSKLRQIQRMLIASLTPRAAAIPRPRKPKHGRQALVTEAGSAPAAPRPVALARSIATVGSLTLVSRLLGFVRDIMIAALLGAGPLADAFFVAFKLPNFLRRLFAEGAFNAGFVPMFARTLEGEGRAAAKAFAEQAQAIQVAVLALVVLTIVAMPWVMALLAPGFEVGSFRYEAAVELSRITFVYILFIALVALYGGVLNSLGRFAAAAAAPISLNLCLIGALILSALWLDAPAHALAWGVAVAGWCSSWLRLALRREGMVPALHRPRLSRRSSACSP